MAAVCSVERYLAMDGREQFSVEDICLDFVIDDHNIMDEMRERR